MRFIATIASLFLLVSGAIPRELPITRDFYQNAAFTSFSLSSAGGGGGAAACSGADPTTGLLPSGGDGWANWCEAGLNAVPVNGYIAGTTLNITTVFSNTLGPGEVISGPGITPGTSIIAYGTGTGLTGSYTVSVNQTVGSSGSPIAIRANGIPTRSTLVGGAALTPNGTDDTSQINTAIASCTPGKVVLLSTGIFRISGSAIALNMNGCTLRGSGAGSQTNTGLNGVEPIALCAPTSGTLCQNCTPAANGAAQDQYCPDATATQLIQIDRATTTIGPVINVGQNGNGFTTSYDLSTDAIQGGLSVTLTTTPSGISAGDIVWIDENADNDAAIFFNGNWPPVSCNCRNFSGYGLRPQEGRSNAQMLEVTSVAGNTVNFNTPLTYPFHTSASCTACQAQLTTLKNPNPLLHGAGVENLFVWGARVDSVSLTFCAYCWVKGVEATWGGTGGNGNIEVIDSFRNVVRDSFIHEMAEDEPGGGSYLLAIDGGSTETLVENNIMWAADKEDVARGDGGGNVLAYNYMDDSFIGSSPSSSEAGINNGHLTTSKLDLDEGNYSQAFKGDSFWGGSIYITAYRNWLSGLRASSPPNGSPPASGRLQNYSFTQSGCTFPYGDYAGRLAVDIQKGSYFNSFVGNVVGISGQSFVTGAPTCVINPAQNALVVQEWNLSGLPPSQEVIMWNIGAYQCCNSGIPGVWSWDPTTVNTITRDANWDWITSGQLCYGLGGTTGSTCSGPQASLPVSFYLTSKPSTFGTHPWPWVKPTTGATSGGSGGTAVLLPAKYCFEHNQMPTCSLP